MQKLKTEDHPNLTQHILKVLAKNHIISYLDFLQEGTEKLSVLTNLNYAKILSIRNYILTKYAAPLVNGATIILKCQSKVKKYCTKIKSLDSILQGGIPIGCITEICGLANSGKTQLCFQMAINFVQQTESNLLYIDTKGDFSAIRIQKILDASGYSHKDMAEIMFRIKVIHVWSMDEMVEVLKALKSKNLAIENLSCIIIDPLSCLMFQHLSDDNKIGLTLLNTFVNYSRYLCKEWHLCMLCVNLQTRWIDRDIIDPEDDDNSTNAARSSKELLFVEKRTRCLGKYWQHIPALVLKLEKCEEVEKQYNDGIQINATVLESSFGKCYQICKLNICDSGVT